MKITISENAVLDSIYARNSLQTYVTEHPGSYIANILTTAQAPALRRVVADAFPAVIASLHPDWEIDTSASLSAMAPPYAAGSEPTLKALLQQAVTEMAVYLLFSAASDSRAVAARGIAGAIIGSLQGLTYAASTITPFRI
ncbi:MAG: hypothetical protein NC405_07020 [Odoribacter sp.]|nr:hypothetical protein [Odoribacter sp.]